MEKYSKSQKSTRFTGISKSKLDNEIVRVASKVLKKSQEIKSFDTGFGSGISSLGTIQKLTTIPQDDTDSGRDGDALRIFKFTLLGSFSFADPFNTGRLLIVRWNQDDSSNAPTSITDVLQTATPYSPFNRDNVRAKKFTVWVDRLLCVGATGPNIIGIEVNKNMVSNIAFQATAATGTGHLYAFMVSDSTVVTHPILQYVARTWYTDS